MQSNSSKLRVRPHGQLFVRLHIRVLISILNLSIAVPMMLGGTLAAFRKAAGVGWREIAPLIAYLRTCGFSFFSRPRLARARKSSVPVLLAVGLFLFSLSPFTSQALQVILVKLAILLGASLGLACLLTAIIFGVVPAFVRATRPFCLALGCAIASLCGGSPAFAQTLPPSTADDQMGLQPYQSYHGGDIDHINLSNGTPNLDLPFLSYSQRGKLHLDFHLYYNNQPQHEAQLCVPQPKTPANENGQLCYAQWTYTPSTSSLPVEKGDVFVGWAQQMGFADTQSAVTVGDPDDTVTHYYYNWSIQMADGSKHPLGNVGGTITWFNSSPSFYAIDSGPFESLDATAWRVNGSLAAIGSGTASVNSIVGPDGVIGGTLDPSGNMITTNLNSNGSITSLADTLGRQIPMPPTASSPSNTGTAACPQGPLPVDHAVLWSVPGPNGGTSNYTFCYAVGSMIIPPTSTGSLGSVNKSTMQLQSIVLPDGHSWNFQYNDPGNGSTYNGSAINYATLTQITLPTGGTISYTYTTAATGMALNCQNGGRFVATRTVNANDGTGPHTWTYSYSSTSTLAGNPNGSSTTTTVVTDPTGDQTVHTFNSLYGGDYCPAYEAETQYYQGSQTSGTLLKTVNTTYGYSPGDNKNGPINVVPTQITTTWPNGKTTTVTKSYDSGFSYFNFGGNPGAGGIYGKELSESASDYGTGSAGPILKITNTNYLALSNPTYLTANMLDLVSSQQITDGSSNQLAKTTYSYDTSSLQSSGVTTQFGAPPNSVRGNLTSVSKWLNTTGGSVTSSTQWYDSGEPYQETDPLGNTTTHSYSSNFAGAYPTQTTNALSQSVTGGYDLNTGLLATYTDANNNTTTFNYDSLRRVTSIVFPADASGNHPQTTFSYSPAGTFPFAVERQKTITPTLTDTVTTTLDGLGRVAETQHATPNGNATVVTTYDADGRKASVTNPYFSTSDPTYGVTQTQYDGLGRVVQTTKADGSITSMSYEQSAASSSTADCTLATDEGGNPRQNCADGLGRLVEVDEPPAGSGTAGTAASGSGTIGGGEQSTQVVVTPAVPGSGSVTVGGGPVQWQTVTSATTEGTTSITITGVEQQNPKGIDPGTGTVTVSSSTSGEQSIAATNARSSVSVSGTLQSTQVLNTAATYATGSVTISGAEQSKTEITTCPNGEAGPIGGGCTPSSTTVYDSGTVSITINGTTYSVSYGQGSTTSTIASGLAGAISSGSLASASASGAKVSITAKSSGTGGNYSLSATDTYSGSPFTSPSFTTSASGGALSGGANATYNTVYDSGTATITVNGVAYNSSWSGSGTTAASIGSALVSALSANSLVSASSSGGTVTLMAKNSGTAGNLSLSASTTHNTTYFSSSSFSLSPSGSALTGGKNTVYDSGTVTLTVDGHSDSATWGQGDTTATVAGKLVSAINADSGRPVNASASGAVVTLTSIALGTIGNYPMSVTVQDTATGFSSPSFSGTTSGINLTGGWPNPSSVDSGTMAVTVGNNTYSVPWGASDFPGSIASKLITAITGNSSVAPSLSGNTVYLNPNQPGSTSYAVSTAYTYDSSDFTHSSFSPTNSVADYGTSTVTVGGHADSTWWSAGATPTSIAEALTNQINGDSAALVSAATVNGSSAPCGTPPPTSAGNSLVSFADSNGGLHWAYFDIGHHVCALSWTSASGYSFSDVTALTGAPAAAGNGLAGFGDLNGGLHWDYLDSSGHVHDLQWNSSSGYSVTDVTAATSANAAAAGSAVAAFADNGGGEHWAYLDASGHVDSMSWSSSNGYATGVDLTATLSATPAIAGSPLAAFSDPSGAWHWAYMGSSMSGQHAYGLNWTASKGYAIAGDLTAATDAPAAASGSALAAFADPSGGLHWAYFGANQHAYNLDLPSGGSYSSTDVTATATDVNANGSAPAAAAGSALAAFADANGTDYWAYLATNGHAYNFYETGGSYSYTDVTAGSSAPVAAGNLVSGFSNWAGGEEQWAYLGANNNVYQISGTNGPYQLATLTGSTNAGVQLTAKSAGASTDYTLTSTTAYDNQEFSAASFNSSNSGSALAGGANTALQTVYDIGTVSLTVGGFTVTAPYQQNSSPSSVAALLAQGLNMPSSSVSALLSGSAVLISALDPGPEGDYSLSWTASTQKPSLFAQPSFNLSLSGSALAGGTNPVPASLSTSPMITLYNYDPLGNLTCVEQHGNATGTGCGASPSSDSTSPWRVRRFTYDSLARLLTASNPESGVINYLYDADGNLLQKTSPAPNQAGAATQTISYCYDPLNRVTGKAYSAQTCANGHLPAGTTVVNYVYDAGTEGIGHLTSLSDQAGSGSYTYDGLGRILTESRTIAGITKGLNHSYNLDSSIASLTYPSGAVITYTPDSAGHVLSALDNGNSINYATNATYEADGQMTGFVSGESSAFGGITNTFTYNNRLQPATISATTATETVLSLEYNFHLGAGDNGNVWGIVNGRDSTRSQAFNYDALNRLTSAQNAGTNCSQSTPSGSVEYWGNSYSYDSWGNLINKTVTKCTAENLNATSDNQNRIHVTSGADYGYDAAGNMTYDATTGNTYTFDQENRIAGAGGYTYTYDADDNRVAKSSGGTGTIYWYMSPGIVAESDLSGNLKSEYVFFAGARIARKDFPSDTVSYYFSDQLKTASVITNSSGTITEDEDYYPWGGEIGFVNGDTNHYKFTGKLRDGETGLDYFGARYYANWTARFLTPDWAAKAAAVPYAELEDPQSLDLYSYVRNRPTVMDDSDGHLTGDPNDPQIDPATGNDQNGVCYTIEYQEEVQRAASQVPDPGKDPNGYDMWVQRNIGDAISDNNMNALIMFGAGGGLLNAAGASAAVADAGVARGMSQFGGIMSSQANAAGGTLYTSTGLIGQDVVGTAVNNALTGGATEINILSGVHGFADGTYSLAPEFLQADQASFGSIPGVAVHDFSTLSATEVGNMVNGAGTTIGAFCNSGACIAAAMGPK